MYFVDKTAIFSGYVGGLKINSNGKTIAISSISVKNAAP